jgi:hypothetical protein
MRRMEEKNAVNASLFTKADDPDLNWPSVAQSAPAGADLSSSWS